MQGRGDGNFATRGDGNFATRGDGNFATRGMVTLRFIVICGMGTIFTAAQGLGRCAGFGNPLYVLMFWTFLFLSFM